MKMKDAIAAAVKNIATHGDTDIFPFPFERHLFHDRTQKCEALLEAIDQNFESHLSSNPPDTIKTLSQVGYTGFRWATQIEPFWNAYYLACVLALADAIESTRLAESSQSVFSYRFSWQPATGKLFKDSTWRHYKLRCLDLSKQFPIVIVTDIADFYPRIYHHRIENALNRLQNSGDRPKRIMKLLSAFSGTHVSYGLPIGGPASRILAELALTGVDQYLKSRQIIFCRYVDDFTIFCADRSTAYKILVMLSEKLFSEGLSLQKKKTRILSAEEYRETSSAFFIAKSTEPSDERKLLNISLRYDPYSPTADEDYDALKAAVREIDIIDILGREVAKVAIDPTVSKQAINAISALEPEVQGGAIRTILSPKNINVLAPVFVTILRLVRSVYDRLPEEDKNFVDNSLIGLSREQSELLSVELNLSYFIQALAQRKTSEKEELLIGLFQEHQKPLIRRLVFLVLSDWGVYHWLTDFRDSERYSQLSVWEKRAFILASRVLGDEGKHWRHHNQGAWSEAERLINDWFGSRYHKNQRMPL